MPRRPTRALSIRQPYAEQILRGTKKIEYRSRPTNMRERVYIYASLTPAPDGPAWDDVRKSPGDLPTGVLVGTVEIIGSRKTRGGYEWDLAGAQRLKKPVRAAKKAQPTFFHPF